jgi:hypothetical protein
VLARLGEARNKDEKTHEVIPAFLRALNLDSEFLAFCRSGMSEFRHTSYLECIKLFGIGIKAIEFIALIAVLVLYLDRRHAKRRKW